jgi:hypothetical protein
MNKESVMIDLAIVSTALESIKTANDLLKGIRATKAIMDNADIQLKISDMAMALADANVALAGVKTEMIEKDEAINMLQKQLEVQKNTIFEEPFYWLYSDETKDGPFCQRCNDADNKMIRLISKHTTQGTHYCTVCSQWYGKGKQLKAIKVSRDAWI